MLYYNRIKYICYLFDITVNDLSDATGISLNTIKKWNSVDPHIGNFITISQYLNVSLDFLVGKTENRSSSKRYEDTVEFANALKRLSNATREVLIPLDKYIACIQKKDSQDDNI